MRSSRKLITTLTLTLAMLAPSASAPAHTLAELCDASEDIIAQCGDLHECVTNPDVDTDIGYCAAPEEGLDFTLCDRRAPVTCGPKQLCRIGTIDPHIGVCDVDPFAGIIVEDQGDDPTVNPTEGEGDEAPEEPGCAAAASGSSPASTPLALIAVLLGGAARRGQRRPR